MPQCRIYYEKYRGKLPANSCSISLLFSRYFILLSDYRAGHARGWKRRFFTDPALHSRVFGDSCNHKVRELFLREISHSERSVRTLFREKEKQIFRSVFLMYIGVASIIC